MNEKGINKFLICTPPNPKTISLAAILSEFENTDLRLLICDL